MSTRTCDLLEDRGNDFKFPKNFGHNIIFTYEREIGGKKRKVRLKSVVRGLDKKPREATLRLTSWAGISIGAIHHYAKISLGYPTHVFASNGRHWGYGVFGGNVPFGAEHVELEVMRRCDKRDIKHDKDMARFNEDSLLYGRKRLGEWTYQFWSEQEAKDAAIKFFKAHFEPGWILVPDSYVEDQRPTFATT